MCTSSNSSNTIMVSFRYNLAYYVLYLRDTVTLKHIKRSLLFQYNVCYTEITTDICYITITCTVTQYIRITVTLKHIISQSTSQASYKETL